MSIKKKKPKHLNAHMQVLFHAWCIHVWGCTSSTLSVAIKFLNTWKAKSENFTYNVTLPYCHRYMCNISLNPKSHSLTCSPLQHTPISINIHVQIHLHVHVCCKLHCTCIFTNRFVCQVCSRNFTSHSHRLLQKKKALYTLCLTSLGITISIIVCSVFLISSALHNAIFVLSRSVINVSTVKPKKCHFGAIMWTQHRKWTSETS